MSRARDRSSADAAAAMARHHIECVPVDYFHWNGFRYTSLDDAVAAAERAASAGRSGG